LQINNAAAAAAAAAHYKMDNSSSRAGATVGEPLRSNSPVSPPTQLFSANIQHYKLVSPLHFHPFMDAFISLERR